MKKTASLIMLPHNKIDSSNCKYIYLSVSISNVLFTNIEDEGDIFHLTGANQLY